MEANVSEQTKDTVTDRQLVIDTLNRLRPADLLDFQFGIGSKPRLKCKLIGYEETKYIVVAIPELARVSYKDQLTLGNGCIVRAIIEGDAGQCIAFRSTINGVINHPQALLFVDYPKQVQMFSLRNQIRITTHVPATLIYTTTDAAGKDESTEAFHGTIIDLSVGGCRLKLPWHLGQGRLSAQEVLVKILFPSRPDEPLLIEGEVKSQNRHDGKHITLGIKFGEIQELIELFNQLGIEENDIS
ncbi:flagellar brake protein [Corallincola spongiicola]|uniref:Flagellar brake protein n=1 Tax=Corallincola spongiicola TaxID=2520508 RepID=A0ABY1WNY0_9GAMM|nr:flagellar brake protein [Corallincola spongiicola]